MAIQVPVVHADLTTLKSRAVRNPREATCKYFMLFIPREKCPLVVLNMQGQRFIRANDLWLQFNWQERPAEWTAKCLNTWTAACKCVANKNHQNSLQFFDFHTLQGGLKTI